MGELKKFRAGFRISLVSGGFWAGGGALFGVALIAFTSGLSSGTLFWKLMLIAAMAVLTGIFGMIGGAFYSLAIAAQSRGGEGVVLTARRAALAGAVGGIALMLLVSFGVRSLVPGKVPSPTLIGMLISSTLYAGFGAATGAAIFGTARRGKLAASDEAPDQIGQ